MAAYVISDIHEMPDVICMVGNHEVMALECLTFLMKEITDLSGLWNEILR